jgi:hypothetical protein
MDLEKNIYSEIDSKRFGFKVGKTDGTIFEKNILSELINLNYKLIIARVDFNNIELINNLEDIGFRIKDIQQTHRFNLINDLIIPESCGDSIIREYQDEDLKEIPLLSRKCFNNYGHYFSNNHLDKTKCQDIYEDWAYNSCTNSNIADKIFVSEFEGKINGYLSFKIHTNGDFKYAAGGMGAVDTCFRGKSIFPNLIYTGLVWGKKIGLDWEEHNTIVNNIPVNNSFIKMGFRPHNHVVTMHYWLNNKK